MYFFYKNKKIDVVGCYNVGNNMYKHCLENHLGIKIDIIQLKLWAEKKLMLSIVEGKEGPDILVIEDVGNIASIFKLSIFVVPKSFITL